jgi:hypothetical protein
MPNKLDAYRTQNQVAAEYQFMDAEDGVTHVYRRFSNSHVGAQPLVFLEHFRGAPDNGDPLFVDTLASSREPCIVLVGVEISTPRVPGHPRAPGQ